MSKAMGNARKVLKKVDHGNRVFTWIPSGLAAAGPPLGSQLGQIGVNIANFVKDFNLKTSINKVTFKYTIIKQDSDMLAVKT